MALVITLVLFWLPLICLIRGCANKEVKDEMDYHNTSVPVRLSNE